MCASRRAGEGARTMVPCSLDRRASPGAGEARWVPGPRDSAVSDDDRSEKRILLIVGGGIAAYKSLELVRALRKRQLAVRCILTRAGKEFVMPLSLASL